MMLPNLRREYCEYIPRFPIVIPRKQHEILPSQVASRINFVLPISLRQMGGQDKRKVDSCIGKHVGPLERGQIKCGDVEVENPISTS